MWHAFVFILFIISRTFLSNHKGSCLYVSELNALFWCCLVLARHISYWLYWWKLLTWALAYCLLPNLPQLFFLNSCCTYLFYLITTFIRLFIKTALNSYRWVFPILNFCLIYDNCSLFLLQPVSFSYFAILSWSANI